MTVHIGGVLTSLCGDRTGQRMAANDARSLLRQHLRPHTDPCPSCLGVATYEVSTVLLEQEGPAQAASFLVWAATLAPA